MVVGIVLAVASAVLFGVSVAVMKYSFEKSKKFSLKEMLNLKWISSFVIGIIGVFMYMAALNMEPLSTVQPISSLTIIIPIIAGVVWFKEKLEVRKWFALAITIVGIFLVILF